ncbi:MAG TPA: helicase C-terminal domain-containing protein [Phycisphaerales bacterium]|nr:helicase C-terminal domain-containing protein [Phycisphaerales bacterium]
MPASLHIAELLAPDGVVAKVMGEGFEVRPQQRRMAEGVARAMETASHLLVEAGTGTGKSFAYLLPAALRAAVHGEVVVISTHTISLQEQLIQKDLPLIKGVIERLSEQGALPPAQTASGEHAAIKGVLVKGRGNYVSVRRLKLASERQDRLFADAAARRSLHVIEDWAMSTLDGTLSTLPPIERMGVWDKVQSDSGNCMGKKCPNHQQCFFQRARAEMDGANILVCNHALFFSDLALRSQDVGFLPAYKHVIFDEAHNIEEVASEHFGVGLTEGRVQHLLTTLYAPRSGKGYLPQLSLASGDTESITRAMALVDKASGAARAFFEDLSQVVKKSSGDGGQGGWIERRPEALAEPSMVRIRASGVVQNMLTPSFRELALRLRTLKEAAKQEADRYEINAYIQRCEMIAADAEVLVSHALRGYAYWAESTGSGGGNDADAARRLTLACGPIEVGPLLKERLFTKEHSVVMTSATLATRTTKEDEPTERHETAFAHTMQRLGCEGAGAMQLGSPFNYAKQVECFVDLRERVRLPGARKQRIERDEDVFTWEAAPKPRYASRGGSHNEGERVASLILEHVKATDGGAFVLFTSFSMLKRCASLLAEALIDLRLPLLAQGRDGSRTLILQRFREDPRSVLFGAASFWQGVDVRGQGLRNVIITKLPFDPPDRPLTQARLELIEQRGGNPFMEESLPRAVIRFKQGFGRLIRSADDHGRVVVLDPRVVTARYGRLFLEALPPGVSPKVLRDGAEEA